MQLISPHTQDFDQICREFRWQIPEFFNIGVAVCDKHVAAGNGDRTALYFETDAGERSEHTFADLKQHSNRLANTLSALGVTPGDRVAIILPQRVEAGIAHIAIYKTAAVALPLAALFRTDAIEYRLKDSGAKVVITDTEHRAMVESIREQLPELEHIIDVDDSGSNGYKSLLEKSSDQYTPVRTRADDPAFLIYTSGTTGPPKGALGAHRGLLGTLPGFEMSQNFFPVKDDVFWTPADWAWTGGLFDALLPSWYYGVPMFGYEITGRFDPEKACEMLARYRVRNGFIPPTALKMLRQVDNLRSRYDVNLRSVMSAGETLGAEIWEWSRDELGIEVNEMCGQTEFNYVVGNCSAILPVRPGSMGKAYPGTRVDPVDADGNVMPVGEPGELAAHRDNPVMFLGYWNNEEATRSKFRGEYWAFGDMCYRDDDGYLWFLGRNDDVISTAGYRVGPGEVEDSLLRHPAVTQAAAIGSPDDLRGQIIKAYVVLAAGFTASDELAREIQSAVKDRLAVHEYPREIEFIDELPMTTTGKVRRIELRERDLKSRS